MQVASPIERPVQITFEERFAAEAREVPPAVCVAAAGPIEGRWLADLLPGAVLSISRAAGQDFGGERLRLSSRSAVDVLPGLDNLSAPSLVRDTVALILGSGAPSVDLVVARVRGAHPWDLDESNVADVLERYLSDLGGTVLLFPDLSGPAPLHPRMRFETEGYLRRLTAFVGRFSPMWRDRYQVALLDRPERLDGADLERAEEILLGADAALCQWGGSEAALRAHGWRSAAAVLGGLVAVDEGAVDRGLAGRRALLAGGRQFRVSRHAALSRSDPRPVPVPHPDRLITVQIEAPQDGCRILGTPTFRRPIGAWPLPALRAAKAIHLAIQTAASEYVFEATSPAQAMALAASIQFALLPFVNDGLLTGPQGSDRPEVSGRMDPSPSRPSLIAGISAVLQPWNRQIGIRVSLRPNSPPELEVT